jgi:DNA-binding response OmpR family regulator
MSYRVLIADTNPSALRALHLAFQDSGYDLYTAEEGTQVLALLQQVQPEAVVLALNLPGASGYELAHQIKSQDQYRDLPLILLQSAFEGLDEEALEGIDYDTIIQKPFDSEALADRIRTLIGGTKTPDSLPEEPEVLNPDSEEMTSLANPEEPSEDTSLIESLMPQVEAGIDEKVKRQISHEVLDMERELEKRIAAKVRAELKVWIQETQEAEERSRK